jgi:hypothetical protein
MYHSQMIRTFIMISLLLPSAAFAQATSIDNVPIAWDEADERYTTVCAKRWHAIKIRDIRTDAVDRGLGAEKQIELESKAVFSGEADCITARVVYRPVVHADVILGARTWVQTIERNGPVACFDGKHCRWALQDQSFVEAHIEIDETHAGVAYVATPRLVQPARIGEPAPPATMPNSSDSGAAAASH